MGNYTAGNGTLSIRQQIDNTKQQVRIARIEAWMYHAGVPEQFFQQLASVLESRSNRTLQATLPLYERLRAYPGLGEEIAVGLLPELITGKVARLVRSGNQDELSRYIDEVVQSYLKPETKEIAVKPGIFKDRHHGTGMMVYGNAEVAIPYRSITDINHSNGKPKRQPPRQIRKLRELAAAVNAGQWEYAVNNHRNLVSFDTNVFGRVSTFRQFLTDVESIILQQSTQHKVLILGHPSYGVPIGYKIVTPAQYLEFMSSLSSADFVEDRNIPRGRPVPRSRGVQLSSVDLERRVRSASRRDTFGGARASSFPGAIRLIS